jgi:hypothetical protein
MNLKNNNYGITSLLNLIMFKSLKQIEFHQLVLRYLHLFALQKERFFLNIYK